MFEISSYFILYEILWRYLSPADFTPFGGYALLIGLGGTLLMTSFGIILRQSPNKSAQAVLLIVIIIGLFSTLFSVIILFNLTQATFKAWIFATFGLKPREAYVYSALLFFGIATIFCSIISRFVSQDPNKDSRLNARQKLQVYAVVSLGFFLGIFLWNWAESLFVPLAIGILFLVEIGSLIHWFYDPLMYILSKVLRPKPNTVLSPTPNKLNQFAILVCAHNEELVIEHLLKSLQAMDYPRSNYSIYVVCDNCRDETADIVRENGAIALVRNDLSRRGKNNALLWAFNKLLEKENQGTHYDAYVVLNADNLVNENYLSEVNTHLNQGHEIMQTYLTSKNPNDSWVSECSSISYWLSNSIYQEAHSRLNLSAQLKGSGMILRPHVLKEIPWDASSLSEELTFMSDYLLQKNKGCHWVHQARFYDERPITLRSSIKQRTRWMQGHMGAALTHAPRLLLSSIRHHSFKQFDMALYLLRPLFILVSLIVYSVRLLFALVFPHSLAASPLIMNFPLAIILVLIGLAFHIHILHREGRLRSVLWLPIYYIFTFTWCIPIFRGLVKRHEHFWISTFHARDLAINDITEDAFFNEAHRRLAGLENLHQLPLGQILLKAAIITGNQLEAALAIQRKNGGYLGNILIDSGAISEDTLAIYINIQQSIRASADTEQEETYSLQLGQILLDARLLSAEQLQAALEYQSNNGGKLGEAVIELQMLSQDALSIFLEVQSLIGANYLDGKMVHELLQAMADSHTFDPKEIETLLLSSGLVSKQQIEAAHTHQKTHRGGLIEALLFLGYLTPEQVNTLKNAFSIKEL